ncbi:MAG: hypothetical protein JOY78_12530 [Pseudonocardia sp.]|nr:hypothetical protein [Pseudonocardia sp.]
MSSSELLGTYLDGHLAGANAGLETAKRLRKHVHDPLDAEAVGRLAEDIDQDREELRRVVERLGEGGHGVKRAVGWVAGKAHRLAVAETLTGSGHLSVLLEAETLAIGIDGKRALWEALLAVVPAYPQLADVDLAGLAERARDQRERVETIRLRAAQRSFSTPG